MKIKICGITLPEDAAAAVAFGATHIGLNFWPGSRRHVTTLAARAVVAGLPPVVKVGVFVNATPEEIDEAVARVGLDLVQLHGDEPPELCERFAGRYIRALRVTGEVDADRYPGAVAILLDAPSAGYGGSGLPFDWALARCSKPFFLAGGLTPDNVAAAARAVRPFGVDVASGVEARPGVKDHDEMRRFILAAKDALP